MSPINIIFGMYPRIHTLFTKIFFKKYIYVSLDIKIKKFYSFVFCLFWFNPFFRKFLLRSHLKPLLLPHNNLNNAWCKYEQRQCQTNVSFMYPGIHIVFHLYQNCNCKLQLFFIYFLFLSKLIERLLTIR